jgi:hypothetical protein
MVQKTFGIYSNALTDCCLYIETGQQYIACWCKHDESKTLQAFELFSFNEIDAGDFTKVFKETLLHSRLLTTSFDKVEFIWGHEKSLCIPTEFYNENAAASYLKLMFGEIAEIPVGTDKIDDGVVIYKLPEQAMNEYSKHYKISTQFHKYSQLLAAKKKDTANSIHLVFYHSHYIVIVYKNDRLQLIQYFDYKVPEDVLYTILNTCDAHELPANEIKILASGMINTFSPLYDTLHAYLNDFSFVQMDRSLFAAEIFDDYPLHYFASFCE